jgi:alkanesulfonate monooxygenase SsuD/methylene tetrahydromethanopterin reductase-like flavin-dependent oxidoreductase (luciferase family)
MAQRLEREGFTGLYCPSPGDGLALCEALALSTREITFGTSIANIYTRHPFDYAQTAAVIHELSCGRFRFGIGVSHGPIHDRLGLQVGKPLDDIRKFVGEVTAAAPQVGGLPPIVLATLRRRMVELSGEIAQGAVWANGARSHMTASLRHLPASARTDPAFFIGNMVPTCIDDDRAAAAAVLRRTLASYVRLPNYQNYWIRGRVRGRDAGDPRGPCARRGSARTRIDVRPLAPGRHLVRQRGGRSRGRRGMAGERRPYAHRGGFFDPRRPDGRPRRADPRVSMTRPRHASEPAKAHTNTR